MKLDTMIRDGLFSGRQMCSPVPVHMARPSESWISGRQSTAVGFTVSEYQNIDVSGRDAQPLDRLAQEQRGLDVHDHALGAAQREAVGAGEARPVEQGVHEHRVAFRQRPARTRTR